MHYPGILSTWFSKKGELARGQRSAGLQHGFFQELEMETGSELRDVSALLFLEDAASSKAGSHYSDDIPALGFGPGGRVLKVAPRPILLLDYGSESRRGNRGGMAQAKLSGGKSARAPFPFQSAPGLDCYRARQFHAAANSGQRNPGREN